MYDIEKNDTNIVDLSKRSQQSMKEIMENSKNMLVQSAPPPDEKAEIDLSELEADLLKPSNADLQLDQIGTDQIKDRLRTEHANAVKLRILLSRQKETNYVQE